MLRYLAISLLMPFTMLAQNEWVLQPWVQVEGTVDGERLGSFVTGLPNSASIPYRVAVGDRRRLYFYTLNSPTDTSLKWTCSGHSAKWGDLNADGFDDLIVSNRVQDWDTVYVYYGTDTGLDTLNRLEIPCEFQFERLEALTIGDINNDGGSDLILGSYGYPNPYEHGRVKVFLNPVVGALPDYTIDGDTVLSQLGYNVAIGDLNGDGLNELAVLGWQQTAEGPQQEWYNYVNIYLNEESGKVDTTLDDQIRGRFKVSWGLAVFDATGDGESDLLWSSQWNSTNSLWYAEIYSGGASFETISDLILNSPEVGGFGHILGNAGDMNGDGWEDIFVTAPQASMDAGLIFVFSGGPNMDLNFDAAVGLGGVSDFGWAVAPIGDINGDGHDDIVVGAPEYEWFSDKGYWGIFLGSSNIPVTVVEHEDGELPTTIEVLPNYPNPFNPSTTISFSLTQEAFVDITVHNILGSRLTRIASERFSGGTHSLPFNGDGLSSGTYYLNITVSLADGSVFTKTRAMTLIR